jgi:large subunit ribosomal protein L7/L12
MKVKGLVKNAATGAPLAGVKVVLAVGERELAVLFSDREGHFEYMEEREYVGQTLNCRVEKEGFKSQEATYKIDQDEVSPGIELVPEEPVEEKKRTSAPPPPPSPPRPWLKIGIGIAAVIVVAVAAYVLLRKPEGPRIAYFKAEPSSIVKGNLSTLIWGTQYADRVQITPTVGTVGQAGSKKVKPTKTTDYILKASNQRGQTSTRKVKVKVRELSHVVIPHLEKKYDVVLLATGNNRIEVIKIIRAVTGTSLRRAKDLVDNLPRTVKKNISIAEARKIKAKLENAGARASVRPAK